MRYSPKHYANALYEALRDAEDDVEFSRRARAFLGVLRKHRALKLLPSIVRAVEELADGKSVKVRSAKQLSQEVLVQTQKVFGAEYTVKEKTAPDLLGGMVLAWDDWRVDGSVHGRLRELQSVLHA